MRYHCRPPTPAWHTTSNWTTRPQKSILLSAVPPSRTLVRSSVPAKRARYHSIPWSPAHLWRHERRERRPPDAGAFPLGSFRAGRDGSSAGTSCVKLPPRSVSRTHPGARYQRGHAHHKSLRPATSSPESSTQNNEYAYVPRL